jgi:hypothetical protein
MGTKLGFVLSGKNGLRVFENRVPRIISGPKRKELTWDWRKLLSEVLHDLYSLPNIFRVTVSR